MKGKRYRGDIPSFFGHTRDLYAELGLHGTRLPDEGLPPREVSGITVYALAKGEQFPRTRAGSKIPQPKLPLIVAANEIPRKQRRTTKRVFAICPVCEGHYSAGHFHQHIAGKHPEFAQATLYSYR